MRIGRLEIAWMESWGFHFWRPRAARPPWQPYAWILDIGPVNLAWRARGCA